MGRGQGEILGDVLDIQQLALDGAWGEDGGVRGLEQGVQNGLSIPALAALGGGLAGLPALHLAGHQPAAGQNECGHEDHGPQGWALSAPLEDAADAQLGLTGGAGQRGGEGGAGELFHIKIPPRVVGDVPRSGPAWAIPADLSPGVEGVDMGAFLSAVSIKSWFSTPKARDGRYPSKYH